MTDSLRGLNARLDRLFAATTHCTKHLDDGEPYPPFVALLTAEGIDTSGMSARDVYFTLMDVIIGGEAAPADSDNAWVPGTSKWAQEMKRRGLYGR